MEFRPSFYEYWNLPLSFQRLEFCPHSFQHCNFGLILSNIGILALSFNSLEFWPSIYKRWNSGLIFINIRIPLLFFQTLVCRLHAFKHWNSGPMFVNNGIPALSFQTYLVFWPHSFKHGILALSLYTMEFWSVSFQTLVFQPYPSKNWYSGRILSNISIPALSFQTLVFRALSFQRLEFRPYPFKQIDTWTF